MDRKHMPSHPSESIHNQPLAQAQFMMRHEDVYAAEKLAKDQLTQYNIRCRIMLVGKDNISLERKIAQLDNRIQLLVHSSVNSGSHVGSHSGSSDAPMTPRFVAPIQFPTPKLFRIPYTIGNNSRGASLKRIPKRDLEQYEELQYIIQQRPQQQTHLLHGGNVDNYSQVLSQFLVMEQYASPNDERQDRQLQEFFASSLRLQVSTHTDKHQFMRSNSCFTHMLSLFARRGKGVGVQKQLLSAKLESICSSACEVDQTFHSCMQNAGLSTPVGERLEWVKLPEAARQVHSQRQELLLEWVDAILEQIYCSVSLQPAPLRWICLYLYHLTKYQWPDSDDSFALSIVGGFICLRFVNPCIASPNSFEIVSETPSKIAKKNLVLIAKIIQNISNGVLFKASEPHLCLLNPYIERQIPLMKRFLFNVTQIEGTTDALSSFLHDHSRESIILTSVGHLYAVHQLQWLNFDQICASVKAHWQEKELTEHDAVLTYGRNNSSFIKRSLSSELNDKRNTFVFNYDQLKDIFEADTNVKMKMEALSIDPVGENEDCLGFEDDDSSDESHSASSSDEFCDLPNNVPHAPQFIDEPDVVYQNRLKQSFIAMLPRAECQSRSGQQELRSVLLRLGEPVPLPPESLKPLNDHAQSLRVSLPPANNDPTEMVIVMDDSGSQGLETQSEDGNVLLTHVNSLNSSSGTSYHDIQNRPRNSAVSLASSAAVVTNPSERAAAEEDYNVDTRRVLQYYYSASCICERGNSLFDLESNPCACAVGFTSVLANFFKSPKLSIPGMASIVYAMLLHVQQYTPSLHVLASRIAQIRTNSLENKLILASSLPANLLIKYLQHAKEWVEETVDPLYYAHIEEDALQDSENSDDDEDMKPTLTTLRKTHSQRTSLRGAEFLHDPDLENKRSYPESLFAAPVQKVTLKPSSPYFSYLFPAAAPPSVRVQAVVELLRGLCSKRTKACVRPLRRDVLHWISNKRSCALALHSRFQGKNSATRTFSCVFNGKDEDIYAPDILYTHRKSVYVQPSHQNKLDDRASPDSVLPTLPTEHDYQRLLRRSVFEKHAQLAAQDNNTTELKFLAPLSAASEPLFEENRFVAKTDMPRTDPKNHTCNQLCIGFCQCALDVACVSQTPQSVRVAAKRQKSGLSHIISKWCSEALVEVPLEIGLEIEAKLQQLRDTLLIVHKHHVQLLEREELYTEYLNDCRKGQHKPSATRTNKDGPSLSERVKGMVFRLKLKGAVQGAVNDLKDVQLVDLFSLQKQPLDLAIIQPQQLRKYQMRILRKKRVVVAENPAKTARINSVTIGMIDSLTCFLTLDGLGIGFTLAIEDLLCRKQALETIFDESNQWGRDMPVVDTRQLRCDISAEERQLNQYTVYQQGEDGESRNHTVLGVDERGKLVSLVWINKIIVIDLIALLERVIHKHFVKP